MLKNYFRKKSKLSIAIDIIILVLIILIAIPQTRKDTMAFILKPTLIIHQPHINKEQATLNENSYLWQLTDMQGNTINFADLKNKVILINMWATWCPPCIAEMSSLQDLYNEYKQDVAFLFITNDNKQEVKTFLENKNYNFPVYFPKTQYPNDLKCNSLPTTFLISKEGKIIIQKRGLAKWNSKRIKKIIDSLTK